MEHASKDLSIKLLSLTLTKLKSLCSDLKLVKSGNKAALVKNLTSFLITPEGNTTAQKALPANEYADLLPSLEFPTTKANCLCNSSIPSPLKKCVYCARSMHTSCMGAADELPKFICPICQLECLNLLDKPIDFLVPPFLLSRGSSYLSNTEKVFNYNPITMNRVNSSRGRIQVQVRSIRLSNDTYTPRWPRQGCLIVNEANLMEFKHSNTNASKERKDESLNITTKVKLGINTIGVMKDLLDKEVYSVAVLLVENVPEHEYFNEILSKPAIPYEEEKERIMKLLCSGEIQSSSITVPVKCSYSMELIENPARGVECDHVQCFDLSRFLRINLTTKTNRWRCPFCKNFVFGLTRNEYFEEILKKARELDDPLAVKIYADGSFEVLSWGVPKEVVSEEVLQLKRKIHEITQVEGDQENPIELD